MTYREPRAMKEIHDIRLKLHEEMKGMTAKEKVAYTDEIARKGIKEYGLKANIISRSKEPVVFKMESFMNHMQSLLMPILYISLIDETIVFRY